MRAYRPLVAFNAHLLAGDPSYRSAGISVYIENLLRGLDRGDYGIRLEILLGGGILPPGVAAPVRRSRFRTHRPVRRILWEQAILPSLLRDLEADLLHAPAFAGPLLTTCPQVITVHDLSFLRHPEFFRAGNRLYLQLITGMACRRAMAVITVSHFGAQEVVSLLRVPNERVFTVYHGVAPRFRRLPREAVSEFRRARGLPDRFILFMGTLEPRKNLIRLIRAFDRLNDPELHLILAGARGWFYEQIFAEVERLGLNDRIHFPGYVAAETQAFWYNAACAFAYVSVYEGFGMPVLEALACGVPAVTSSSTSLPEAGGPGVLMVSPEDETAIADGLHRIVSEGSLRQQLAQDGLAYASGFSWEKTAEGTADVYRWVVARKGTK